MKQLIVDYPLAKQELLVWERKNVERMQAEAIASATEEITIPEVSNEQIEEVITMALQFAPRFLYNFLDKEGIYMGIRHNGTGFYYDVNNTLGAETLSTREEAENKGWDYAFSMLEEKLKTAKIYKNEGEFGVGN